MAENGRLGPPFWPKTTPKKLMCFPFLPPFPGNGAHKPFSGGPKLGGLGRGQEVCVEKSLCAFSVPYDSPRIFLVTNRSSATIICGSVFLTWHPDELPINSLGNYFGDCPVPNCRKYLAENFFCFRLVRLVVTMVSSLGCTRRGSYSAKRRVSAF